MIPWCPFLHLIAVYFLNHDSFMIEMSPIFFLNNRKKNIPNLTFLFMHVLASLESASPASVIPHHVTRTELVVMWMCVSCHSSHLARVYILYVNTRQKSAPRHVIQGILGLSHSHSPTHLTFVIECHEIWKRLSISDVLVRIALSVRS